MLRRLRSLSLPQLVLASLLLAHAPTHLLAQASPAGVRNLPGGLFDSITAFGAIGETNIGFGAKNISVTAGADLRFRPLFGLEPAVEFRGMYPIHSGSVASEENFLYGPVVRARLGRLHPYVDFLVGRGAINYQGSGYLYGTDLYSKSFTAIHSPGAGLDVDMTGNLAFKIDGQWQLLWSPVVVPDHMRSPSVTVGLQYRLHLPTHDRKRAVDIHDGSWQPLHSRYPGMDTPSGGNASK